MSRFSIINLVFFQAAWFLAAWFTDAAAAFLLLLFCCHFVLSPSKAADFKVLIAAGIGISTDQLLLALGVFNTQTVIVPIWLVLLWACLAVSLNHSLGWLKNLSIKKTAFIGALAGPASYYSAIQFDALSTSLLSLHFLILQACVWAFLLPVLVYISKLSTGNAAGLKVTI